MLILSSTILLVVRAFLVLQTLINHTITRHWLVNDLQPRKAVLLICCMNDSSWWQNRVLNLAITIFDRKDVFFRLLTWHRFRDSLHSHIASKHSCRFTLCLSDSDHSRVLERELWLDTSHLGQLRELFIWKWSDSLFGLALLILFLVHIFSIHFII